MSEFSKQVNTLQEAIEIIQWFIDNDETNEGDIPLEQYGGRTWDEMNDYWIKGKRRAEKFVKENS